MARTSHFQRGSGCFNCEACGRKTRDTGDQGYGIKLCPQCYDLAGIYNVFQDEGSEGLTPYLDDIQALTKAIVAKGGTLDSDHEELLTYTTTKETTMNTEITTAAVESPKASAKKAPAKAPAKAAKKAAKKAAPAKAPAKKVAPAAKKAPAKKAATAAPRQGTYKDLAANHAGASTAKSPVSLMWDLCNKMQDDKRKDVIAKAVEMGIGYYTARTQYQLWLTAWRNS